MKLTRENLLAAVRSCARVVDKAHTLPALTHLRITRDATGTHFTGTDLVIFLTHTIPDPPAVGELGIRLAAMRAESEACDFLAPLATLERCVRVADAGTTVDLNAEAVRFTMNGMDCRVPVLSAPPDKFPALPELTARKAAPWCVTADAYQAIQRARPCISKDETRYVLNGIYWDSTGSIVATDGRRLFRSSGHPSAPDVIIPTEAVGLIEENMEADTDGVTVEMHSLTVRLYAKLVAGIYPNYRQVIPTYEDLPRIRVNGDLVGKNLARLTPPTTAPSVKLHCLGGQSMRFSMSDGTNFTAPIRLMQGSAPAPKQCCSFNPSFLAEGLLAGFDTMHLDFKDAHTPATLTNRTARDLYVLMPMRLSP